MASAFVPHGGPINNNLVGLWESWSMNILVPRPEEHCKIKHNYVITKNMIGKVNHFF